MRKNMWAFLVIAAALCMQGCIIPRTAVGVVKGVTKGTIGVVKGAAGVVTAPL